MFSPQVQAQLERDFVIVKIDTDRYKQGQEILNQVRGGKSGGIPWFAFLEPDARASEDKSAIGATVKATSDIMDGRNVGSPYTAAEIAAFDKLLRSLAKNIDEEGLALLHKTLVAQGEKPKKQAKR